MAQQRAVRVTDRYIKVASLYVYFPRNRLRTIQWTATDHQRSADHSLRNDARAQVVNAGFPPRWPGSGHVGSVMDKVALGQVFSEYFGFPCQSSFHQLLHNHPHLSSGGCTIGQKWPQYQVDLVPPH
jgi:hypothetical protein